MLPDFAARRLRNAYELSNPMIAPNSCGRKGILQSSICDPDLMLSQSQKDLLDKKINAITTAKLAVAVVSRIEREFIGNKKRV